MKLGSTDISKIYLGSTEVTKAYLGSAVVHEGKTIIDQLKDLGCVMWFPLKANGQLSDVIGGKTIVPNGNVIRWSSPYYYVMQGLNNSKQGDIALDWTSADFPDGEWTTVMESKRNPTSSYYGNANVFRINSKWAIQCFALNANNEPTGLQTNWQDDNWHSTFCVNSANSKKLYIDGVYIKEESTPLQEPWGYSGMTINTIGNYNNKRVPFRNVMIFNKALSAVEIAKVIQLINK